MSIEVFAYYQYYYIISEIYIKPLALLSTQ